MDPTTDPKDLHWVPISRIPIPIPIPTGVRGLQDLCMWLNYTDGVLTAHTLTRGSSTEVNWFMRAAWGVSPVVYASLKWWLFWVGLNLLERSFLVGSPAGDIHTRRTLLRGVLVTFSLILVWHVTILRLSR